MARNTDPKCRQCRREGEKLFLKGDKCYTDKCAIERRAYPFGHAVPEGMLDAQWRTYRCSIYPLLRITSHLLCDIDDISGLYF